MAPQTVEEDTLGEKHRNYNNLVNDAIKTNSIQHITAINYEEPDLENFYKIDVACKSRNVEYVIEVLKCEDMLYVFRAIKQSTWLITDEQYASIINPEYLYLSLYPKMTSKAFNKLILHVRLHLKVERRVEDFFNYCKRRDLQNAMKWLPGCSDSFIEDVMKKHSDDISDQVLKRLYKKSITFLAIFIQNSNSDFKMDKISPAMFHLKRNIKHFLDIIEANGLTDIPSFGPKYTKRVMENYPERIMKNFGNYAHNLDIDTFAKFVKKEDAKNFILTNIKNTKIRHWFQHPKLKYFLNRLPVEERFDFIIKYFIEKSIEVENLDGETWDDVIRYSCPSSIGDVSSSNSVYGWYVYAPFSKAFGELKKMIRSESDPTERLFIFLVLLTCAGSNMNNIRILLKYYREHHINEPFKFKIQFINQLISKTHTHKYDKEVWGYLNDLFNSMEVYTKSDKNVQSCVKTIILRNLVNDEYIPEIIEQKFEYENLDNKQKFNTDEREKIFNFLYKYLISKIEDECNTENKFCEIHDVVVNVLNLLKDWNKDLNDYPYILQKIKDLVVVRKENRWDRDLGNIYNVKKSWRKLLLAESILISPTDERCINALKHNLQLLQIYKNEIDKLCINDNILLERFLKKIRIYYHQSLASSFEQLFLENLNQINSHDMLSKGLCILLSRKYVINFIHKYAPADFKIDWSQPDNEELSLRKHIAKSMQLARPQPPLDVALEYAKGDYLQYALPSLNAILYNISVTYLKKHLMDIFNAPVFLQKLGTRVAFTKLNHEELKNTFSEVWKSSENSTIRPDIFCHTYKLLCKESDESAILEIWELLSMFIDKVSVEENKKIYVTLSKADKVPLLIKPAFVMKSYEVLKKLPVKANCSNLIDVLKTEMHDIYEFLEIDFMSKIFLDNFVKKFSTYIYEYTNALAQYLLSARNEKAQMERYEKILLPLIDQALTMWDVKYENIYYTRHNLRDIFSEMSDTFEDVVLNKKMIFPIAMYTAILNKLQSSLSEIENYVLLTSIKLSLGYIQILQDLKMDKEIIPYFDSEDIGQDKEDKWKNLYTMAAPVFGKLCVNYLKEDIAKYSPAVYTIFVNILRACLHRYVRYDNMCVFKVLKVFVDNKDLIEGQILVLSLMPGYLDNAEEKAFRLELINELGTHLSEQVAMHYWDFRRDNNL